MALLGGNTHSMRQLKSILLLLLALQVAFQLATHAQTPEQLSRDWQQQHITRIEPSRVKHADLKKYLDGLREAKIAVREVGRSVANREVYEMEFGSGSLKIFMWSQMHGDEPTATSALLDMFHYLQRNRDTPWVKKIAEKMTIRAVPMLNPDGAELYQRLNLQFIDINRDARTLATPEGRLLKRLRDEWSPDIGFNLHNQNPRTAVGNSRLQATVSLLAVAFDDKNSDNAGRIRNKKLCAVMTNALAPFIKNHIGRYDDEFNPRAFGDQISKWGTPVILVETGALKGMSEMDLVRFNFVAYLSALHALADGSAQRADPKIYEQLPYNTGGTIFDTIVRGGTIINRLPASGARIVEVAADLSLNESGSGGRGRRASVQDVGDLSVFRGLEEIDATGYNVIAPQGALRPGADGVLLFYRKDRKIDPAAPDMETAFPPDAVYRHGEWRGKEKLKTTRTNS